MILFRGVVKNPLLFDPGIGASKMGEVLGLVEDPDLETSDGHSLPGFAKQSSDFSQRIGAKKWPAAAESPGRKSPGRRVVPVVSLARWFVARSDQCNYAKARAYFSFGGTRRLYFTVALEVTQVLWFCARGDEVFDSPFRCFLLFMEEFVVF